jgi:uncharacterized protein YoaH (UPF0181 family)
MGARDKNFYKDYVSSIGFEEAAEKIQKLYLEGRKGEAIQAVPDELVDRVNLVGPPQRIRDNFQAWKQVKVGTMLVGTVQIEAIRLMAELVGS